MDDAPEIPKLELFEGEFQKFMHGAYTHTLEEEWERFYSLNPKINKKSGECPHGKTKLSCPHCYFGER